MCGIVAFWNDGSVPPLPESTRHAMRDAMAHRGPDDAGEVTLDDGRLWFGHRRLSVLDLTERGRQPMSCEHGRLWITYNGEIFNYRELRRELEAGGDRFRTETDTEVILAAYRRWGTDCLERLNGMWAFALWDRDERRLFVARDRFGIKPLYYAQTPSGLLLASELRGILASGLVPARPHEPSVVEYLTSGVVDGLAETMVEGIHRFPPGHFSMTAAPRLEPRRYWRLPGPDEAEGTAVEEAAGRLHDLVQDSVRQRLVSDVPVGTCLSGGLDSSAIFAFANQAAAEPLRAFTAYFTESEEYDERRFASAMCRKYDAKQFLVQPDASRLWELLPRITWHLEEPPLAMGVFPQWHVLELAASHVTVVLDGQGGDEVLAGYDRYMHVRVRELARRRSYGTLLREIHALRDRTRRRHLLASAFPGLNGLRGRFRNRGRLGIDLADCLDRGMVGRRPTEPELSSTSPDLVNRQLIRDVEYQSLPALLKYEDKLGMAFSLEARMPFLDYRLVEFLFRQSSDLKFRGGWSKDLLRRATRAEVPEEIRLRRDKRGFPTPVDLWFRGELADRLRERVTRGQAVANGWLRADRVGALLDRHVSGEQNAASELWRLACLETWLEQLPHLADRSRAARTVRASVHSA